MGGVGRLPFSNHHHPSHHYHNNNINIAAAAAVTEQQQQDAGDQCIVREQDRFMPIANVIRIMRKILPPHAKISDEAKETIQECVSEYISFITGEANDRCQREQRKTITAEDVLWAMSKLGFDDYIEPLTLYLHRYREFDTNGGGGSGGSSGVFGGGTTTLQQQHSVLMFKRTAAAAAAVDPPPVGVQQQQQHANIMYPPPAAAASGHHGPISAFHLHPASAAYGSSSMPMPTIGFVGGGLHRPHHHQRRRHPSNSNGGGGGASTSQAHDQAPIN